MINELTLLICTRSAGALSNPGLIRSLSIEGLTPSTDEASLSMSMHHVPVLLVSFPDPTLQGGVWERDYSGAGIILSRAHAQGVKQSVLSVVCAAAQSVVTTKIATSRD